MLSWFGHVKLYLIAKQLKKKEIKINGERWELYEGSKSYFHFFLWKESAFLVP